MTTNKDETETETKDEAHSRVERYVYSLDGREYRARDEGRGWETRAEALAAGRERAKKLAELKDEPQGPVWTGIQVPLSASAFFPDGEWILDFMAQAAGDEVGSDLAEGWPDVDTPSGDAPEGSAERELHEFVEDVLHPFLQAFVEKHDLSPTFWQVSDVVKHADDDGDGAIERAR